MDTKNSSKEGISIKKCKYKTKYIINLNNSLESSEEDAGAKVPVKKTTIKAQIPTKVIPILNKKTIGSLINCIE